MLRQLKLVAMIIVGVTVAGMNVVGTML